MEGDEDSDEDLTDYAVQLGIQESLSAERSQQRTFPSHETRFVPVSDQNRKLVAAIREGQVYDLQNYVKNKYALDEADERGWFPLHEAAIQPIQQILEVVLDASYKSMWEYKTCDGETPLTLAAKSGHAKNIRTLLAKGVWPNTMNRKGETPLLIGGDVNATADDGSSILFEAAGGGNPDCIALLLEYGGSGNLPNKAGHLPIHRAANEGHYLALKFLIPVTSRTAIRKSGQSPIHSAADGQNPQCLELLIENGFDVNVLLSEHISQSYDDERKTALYFAVSNNDILSTEILLKAGADPNKDPLNCLLVAVRANNHEIVRLLLSYGANVNCYFNLVNDTHFPSAIQYALNDEVMLRLLLNHGYNVDLCFDCIHGSIFGNSFLWPATEEEVLPGWTSCVIKDNPFCDFITVPWMKHLVGPIVRILIDYMDYVPLCTKLKFVLETQKEWPEIQQILENPRPLKHLCRLKIRKYIGLVRTEKTLSMKNLPLPPTLTAFILFKEYDLYGRELHLE
ncbi:ankyrin repeat and SOCS box protein 15 isoform X2 [Python bivittatus]|uniref:Ankyrin repeat and SOCS box protein 15 isoform X2 n=1 Tax=Python bivittatus TaxID=176946 RepID=A0A9F5MR56_PYTBI|nr:ankyrin repeat and SOCS box protein 15 isoform X2 [Python bivittatus]